jgi:ATP-dependent RNA helicase DDX18/HAS1
VRQLADLSSRLCFSLARFSLFLPPPQLEKLISKNYYLHQSARDGFRAYIQSYASYSLKTIFDVAALDLAKVGKAFGFAVPPSVNINIGSGLKGKKRKVDGRGSDIEAESNESSGEEEDALDGRRNKAAMVRRGGKGLEKRKEVMGAKKTEKDFYREGRERQAKASEGKQWSR